MRRDFSAPSFSVRRVIYWVLGLQVLIAVLLMGGDLLRALPYIGGRSDSPAFDTPVNPGDQTRRYRPRDMPLAPAREGNPDRPYRSTGDMPDRLTFVREGETLLVTGGITEGDAKRFRDYLAAEEEAGAAPFGAVRLNSPGGAVADALAIGRHLRKAALDTFLGAGDICLSACPYVLASGVNRAVSDEAQVGVHQHYFGQSTVLPAFMAVEDVQRGQGEVMMYLEAMGIDPLLMQHALVTPPEEIYVFLPAQLRDYRLVLTQDEPS
ncbi:hypothetical protein [uncultured Sulfitobacter sp.]|uniref:COG3904 family protein n=1 Tax=uncultured Sulfitobacter sp. TaxID=191468 RepID=UPI00260CADC3|nr:hypothetical protein [uncultured Sulfitobacter sp.]